MIEDRSLSEFEIDCIAISQIEIRKDPLYKKLVDERFKLETELLHLPIDKNYLDLIFKVCGLNYQCGFWDGQEFNKVKNERRGIT